MGSIPAESIIVHTSFDYGTVVQYHTGMTNLKAAVQKIEEGSATDGEVAEVLTGMNGALLEIEKLADEALKSNAV